MKKSELRQIIREELLQEDQFKKYHNQIESAWADLYSGVLGLVGSYDSEELPKNSYDKIEKYLNSLQKKIENDIYKQTKIWIKLG